MRDSNTSRSFNKFSGFHHISYEDIDAEEMEITHIAAHRGQIRRGWIPRARGRATPSNHYQVNLEIFLEDFNTVEDELEDEF